MDVCTPEVISRDCTNLRKEGGKGLILSIEECVRKESKSMHGHLRETTEWMPQAALEGEGVRLRRESPGIPEEKAGGELNQELKGESAAWRVCAKNSRCRSCSWRRFLKMA